MVGLSLAGLMIHAKFDFPLQIYSIVFVAILLSVLLFSSSGPAARRSS
jgi:hypothetical protein